MVAEVDHLRDQKLFFKLYLAKDCTLILVGLTDMVYDIKRAVCDGAEGPYYSVFSSICLPCGVLSQCKASNNADHIFSVLKTSVAKSHLLQSTKCTQFHFNAESK